MAETGARTTAWIRNFDVETDQPVEGSIKGQIPIWLEGSLIRNGSGIHEIGTSVMDHLFDGLAVMHQFAISNGQATYRNRILKSDTYLTSKAANRLTVGQFGTFSFPDPCKSLLARFMSRFQFQTDSTDSCGVNICFFGDKLYAMTETSMMREVDPKTLETIGEKVDLSKLVAVHHATAHPHVDPDGTVYNMGNSAGSQGCKYNIIRFPPGEKSLSEPTICASFTSRWKMSHSYYHSFAITENYFIFVEFPLTLNVMKLMTMPIHRKPYSSLMEWNSSAKTRILLADRKSGQMFNTVYETRALFCFHHGNAYEKDGHVVIDLCSYDDATIISDLSTASLKQGNCKGAPSQYSRWVIPLKPTESKPYIEKENKENLVRLEGTECRAFLQKDGSIWCEPEILFNGKIELPRINYSLNGKEYNYVYGVQFDKSSSEVSSVVKINVKTRDVTEWSKPGFSPSEPVFVASPNATAEDDGVVLFSAVDFSDNQKVLLVILDASTFEEKACVEFTAKGAVTKDFHGIFAQGK